MKHIFKGFLLYLIHSILTFYSFSRLCYDNPFFSVIVCFYCFKVVLKIKKKNISNTTDSLKVIFSALQLYCFNKIYFCFVLHIQNVNYLSYLKCI